jgi:hypothetical protein
MSVRELFGPRPLRRIVVDPGWLCCNGGLVRRLVEVAYGDRTPLAR